ncbi:PREDICTED: DNA polymerase delta subunit 3-like [Papilio polytes]|uniref:DNA polymerase delta subunit 3-like n=1 Tax=Papilio polytes TaxID=76194 RepID=UPI000675D925|nr:PREDICTED: DNA polymerase delta subunit 3-like [Papilio polytes]
MANLNTLQDMILDEEKLVTYISLSKELCIHVNESKMLLQQFVDDMRQKKPKADLTVSYIVSGLNSKNSARTAVCTEAELEPFKKDFKTIFYAHIYSVAKGSSILDNASLLATNKLDDLILCTGIIKNNNCIKRTADEIGTLKSNSQDILLNVENNTHTVQKKIKKENDIQKSSKEPETKKVEARPSETKLANNIKSENCSPKKSTTSKQKVNNVSIKQKGIAGFFSKANENSSNKNVTEERKMELNTAKDKPKTEIKEENTSEDIVMSDVQADSKDKQVQKAVENNITTNKYHKKDNSSKVKTSPDIKKNMTVDKKRKRIVVQSDSESENEVDNDPFVNEDQTEVQNESDDEIPPTPTIDTIKITSGILNPKKRRKLVDKTYTSEDGYILTKKEEVYESCSENEEEISKENVATKHVQKIKLETSPKQKKNEVKHAKKKISPPKSGKQQTLMNFFKKS